jgi:hypothetical protein
MKGNVWYWQWLSLWKVMFDTDSDCQNER